MVDEFYLAISGKKSESQFYLRKFRKYHIVLMSFKCVSIILSVVKPILNCSNSIVCVCVCLAYR